MKVQSAVLSMAAMAVGFGAITGACSTTSNPGPPRGALPPRCGPPPPAVTGGSGSTSTGPPVQVAAGAGEMCSNVTACGGIVAGTWTVTSSCLTVSGNLDVSSAGADTCTPTVTGSFTVTGSITIASDGTYTDNTVTKGDEQASSWRPSASRSREPPPTARHIGGPIQGQHGYASVTCTDAAGGGCTCVAEVNQAGGLAWASPNPQSTGNYKTANNVLTLDDNREVLVLRRGNHADVDPADDEFDHRGYDCAPKRRRRLDRRGWRDRRWRRDRRGRRNGCGRHDGRRRSGRPRRSGRHRAVATVVSSARAAAGGSGGSPSPDEGPCDIYAAADDPLRCGVQHDSVTREDVHRFPLPGEER